MNRRISVVVAAVCLLAIVPVASAQEVAVEVFKKLSPSVVKFLSPDGDGFGTGFIIHPSGIVLTNKHVAGAMSSFHIAVEYRDANNDKQYATYKKVDTRFRVHPDYDLAICRIDPSEHPNVTLIPVEMYNDEVLPGMSSFAIGHPRGGSKSISVGNISSVDTKNDQDPESLPHTMSTAIVQGGNSGGPVVDSKGRVLGVATFFITDPRGGSALTGCVPRKVWKDFSTFTTWDDVKGNPEQAQRMEKYADTMLKQLEEAIQQHGSGHPVIDELMAQVGQMYARALSADPGNTRLMLKVARVMIRFDQKPRAIGMLVELIDKDPWAQPDSYGLLALAMTGMENPGDDVLVAAEEGIAKFPRNALAWVGKGEYHGVVKKDWEEAMLWEKVGYDLYTDTTDLITKSVIQDTYNAARDKLKEQGGREPHPAEIEGIMTDKVEGGVAKAAEAKKAGTRYINSAFEQLVQQFKPEPPPKVADDFDLNKLMAELEAGGGAAPPVAGPVDPAPGTPTPPSTTTPAPSTPTPPTTANDADGEEIDKKIGLAKLYWSQRTARPDFERRALTVLKQLTYKYPDHPKIKDVEALMKQWASE